MKEFTPMAEPSFAQIGQLIRNFKLGDRNKQPNDPTGLHLSARYGGRWNWQRGRVKEKEMEEERVRVALLTDSSRLQVTWYPL
jgi:hypothetical protein